MTSFPTVRVAAIQATPVILDAEGCVDEAERLLHEAADRGAQLAVLPECFIPLYPSNAWAAGAAGLRGWDELWDRLWTNSVDVPGPLVDRLVAVCRERELFCVLGVNERESERPGTLYNTIVYLGPSGLLASMRHIAIESGAFVVSVPQFIPSSAFPDNFPVPLPPDKEVFGRGGAAIIEPSSGDVIGGPLYHEEGIVEAECDLRVGLHAKRWFDSVGHYSREDVFAHVIADLGWPAE